VVGLIQFQSLVFRGRSQQIEHRLDRCLEKINRVVPAIQHQSRNFDPGDVAGRAAIQIEASEGEAETLLGRRFDEVKLVVIYIDGMVFGDHVMIGAVGVDAEGHKHVLAIREGATENATVVKELLEDLIAGAPANRLEQA
jgi:hypothetical protein